MEDQLFDAGPPVARGSSRQRPGDRDLYQPQRTHGRFTASREENIRVRALLQAHMEELVNLASGGKPTERHWGRARGDYARDWVALTGKLGIRQPGNPRKRRHRAGQTPVRLREDAGKTNLRQFLEGKDMPEWMLVGIEAVWCNRRGLALPAKAYQEQRKIA